MCIKVVKRVFFFHNCEMMLFANKNNGTEKDLNNRLSIRFFLFFLQSSLFFIKTLIHITPPPPPPLHSTHIFPLHDQNH